MLLAVGRQNLARINLGDGEGLQNRFQRTTRDSTSMTVRACWLNQSVLQGSMRAVGASAGPVNPTRTGAVQPASTMMPTAIPDSLSPPALSFSTRAWCHGWIAHRVR